MKTSVQINVRLSREMRGRFADLCAQQGLSVSEALRRMIERAVILKTVTPDDDIWDAISKGQLPAGFKNRFAMLPELTKDLPEKDYEGDDLWLIRPENEWKDRDDF
jgi:ribbon-helix-helix protein, copG family